MSAIKPVTQVQQVGEYATLMNTDTQGTGTLPAPRSYMLTGRAQRTLVQATRGRKVGYNLYEWTLVGTGQRMLAGERPDYMSLTYEQDRELRERYA